MLNLEEALSKVHKAQHETHNHDSTMTYYDHWNPTYDQTTIVVKYKAPKLVVHYLDVYADQCEIAKDSRILDVAAGTGLIGEALHAKGYVNIDATDASITMLDTARQKAVYSGFFCCRVGDGYTLPIPDNTYAAAVIAGAFLEGHVKGDALLEMIRVVRPGGLIINCMRKSVLSTVAEYKQLPQLLEKWQLDGLWQKLAHITPAEEYYCGEEALIHIYKTTK